MTYKNGMYLATQMQEAEDTGTIGERQRIIGIIKGRIEFLEKDKLKKGYFPHLTEMALMDGKIIALRRLLKEIESKK